MLNISDTHQNRLFISQTDVINFAKISHDTNPIHMNIEASQSAGFDRPIVHGALLIAYISHIYGNSFPVGAGTIICEQKTRFFKPVYVDSWITLNTEIKDILFNKHKVIVLTKINNEVGLTCVEQETVLKIVGL
jgi:3-hydroxybutyryl-CoA dehydratase